MLTEVIFSTSGLFSILFALLGYVFYYYLKLYLGQKNGKMPPGPWGVPLIGYLPFLKQELHEQILDLTEKYGPVIQMKIGQESVLFLNDSESIREALRMPAFNGRVNSLLMEIFKNGGEKALGFNSGKPWKTARREAIKALSLFSTSKNSSLEAVSTKAVSKLIEKLNHLNEDPVLPRHLLMHCSAAMLSNLAFGLPMDDQDNPELEAMFSQFDDVIAQMGKIGFLEFLPIFAIFYRKSLAKVENGVKTFVKFIWEKINAHQYDGTVRTIVDGLKKAAEEADEKELAAVGFTRSDIKSIAIDLFDGGLFTTPETSHWLQLLLAAHPDAQARVHEELDRVTGGLKPGILDQEDLPFMNACILEALRFSTTLPFSVPHATMEDVVFRGYHIPANTMVMPNLWAVNHDSDLFLEPFKFLPQRFLTEDSSQIDPDTMFKIMTFSVGGRRCVGENFAKQALFIINSHILHEFEVALDPTYQGDPLAPKFQFTLAPGDAKLIYKKR